MAQENTPITPEGAENKPEEILGEFVKQECLLILIHMPTRQSTSSHQPLKHARAWAEHAVTTFNNVIESRGEKPAPASDFIVVEIRRSGTIRTTILEKYEAPAEAEGDNTGEDAKEDGSTR